jgi:hypothetical protein
VRLGVDHGEHGKDFGEWLEDFSAQRANTQR